MPLPTHRLTGAFQQTLLAAATITAAAAGVVSTPVTQLGEMKGLIVQAVFTYGSGGTKVTVWVQTSFDGGTTWVDIMSMTFTTATATKISSVLHLTGSGASYVPTDGALLDDSIKDGLLGDRLRVKYTSTGTYAGGTTLAVTAVSKG